MEIYLHQDGERAGPFTLENVQGRLEGGQLTVSDAAWFEGCSDWVTVQDVPGIMLPGGDHLVEVATVPPFDAYQGDEPYVFISYAHKDAAVVYDEIKRLHEAGSNVWYDEGIEASNEWPEEIAQAVVRCSVFLVFVSPRATASVNCRNEINMALNKNKPFLAIYLEETELPLGLELRMGDLQAILRYKLPQDRYQRKAQDAIEQLLGKKPSRSQTRPPIPQQTGATHEPEPAEQAVQTTTSTSKPRRKGLAVALASVLLIACGALGYLFLGDDGEEATETSTATFTPGQPWTVPTASIEMLWCEPGIFMMGSPESEEAREIDYKGRKTKWDETQHQVTLTKGFYLGKYEVTQAQWKKVMGTSPSNFFGEKRPVEKVNWAEAVRFCQELTLTERKAGLLPDGWGYTLPTEAQWEYACRAGTTTVFSWGDSATSKQANFKGTQPYGGAAVGPNLEQTTDVGSYAANPWGFFDMHGNVREWCSDFRANYPGGPLTDPTVGVGLDRVLRGGSWSNEGPLLRSAVRSSYTPAGRSSLVGFRLCLRQTKVEQPKVPTPGQPWTVPTVDDETPTRGKDHFHEVAEEGTVESTDKQLSAAELVFLPQGLVAYYPFDGNASDMSGNGNHGKVQDAHLHTDKNGELNSAYEFRGKGRIVLPESPKFELQKLTLSAWMDIDLSAVGNQARYLIEKHRKGSSWQHYSLRHSPNEAFTVFSHNTQTGANAHFSTTYNNKGPKSNQWTMITGTYDGLKNKLYVDGTLVDSREHKVNILNDRPFDMNIGGQQDDHFWRIDDARIYDRALSAVEVKALYDHERPKVLTPGQPLTVPSVDLETPTTRGKDHLHEVAEAGTVESTDKQLSAAEPVFLPQGLVAYYPFDGNASDMSGNGNHGKVNGATLTSDRFGNRSGAYNFTGSSSIQSLNNIGISGNSPRAVSLWCKADSLQEHPSGTMIFWGDQSPDWRTKFAINFPDTLSHPDFMMNAHFLQVWTGPVSNITNQWLHLVYTSGLKLLQKTPIFHLNGQALGSWNISGGDTLETRDSPLVIGSVFTGQIDDVRIYDRALSAVEVKALYDHEQPKVPTPGQPWTVPSVDLEMLWCKPGTFLMGSPESEKGRNDEETQHAVTLTQGYWLGKHEVMQAQWEAVMGTNPSEFKGANLPVEKVSWPDAVSFCKKLTERERKAGRLPEGYAYQLPTEAQWEYACRAGTTTVFAFGDSLSSKQANFNGTKPYGGASTGPNLKETTDVGSYQPNAWGFHDMHGNVTEWCADWYDKYPIGPLTNPMGPALSPYRVIRSGFCNHDGTKLRSAKRMYNSPGYRYYPIGFRPSLRQVGK